MAARMAGVGRVTVSLRRSMTAFAASPAAGSEAGSEAGFGAGFEAELAGVLAGVLGGEIEEELDMGCRWYGPGGAAHGAWESRTSRT
jgi:hypothetical protein